MTDVSTDVAIEQLLAVLAEAFEGPKQRWSYFIDQGAESGQKAALSRKEPSHKHVIHLFT